MPFLMNFVGLQWHQPRNYLQNTFQSKSLKIRVMEIIATVKLPSSYMGWKSNLYLRLRVDARSGHFQWCYMLQLGILSKSALKEET